MHNTSVLSSRGVTFLGYMYTWLSVYLTAFLGIQPLLTNFSTNNRLLPHFVQRSEGQMTFRQQCLRSKCHRNSAPHPPISGFCLDKHQKTSLILYTVTTMQTPQRRSRWYFFLFRVSLRYFLSTRHQQWYFTSGKVTSKKSLLISANETFSNFHRKYQFYLFHALSWQCD